LVFRNISESAEPFVAWAKRTGAVTRYFSRLRVRPGSEFEAAPAFAPGIPLELTFHGDHGHDGRQLEFPAGDN
jgi:hypothetical protein